MFTLQLQADIFSRSDVSQVKQMAAVLLRRLLSSSFEEIYPGLTLEMQTAIKTELLTSIQHETSPNIRKKVCDIAAELCRNLIGEGCSQHPCCMPENKSGCRLSFFYVVSNLDDDGNNQWPEVLKFLFDSVNSDNVGLREAALHIFW